MRTAIAKVASLSLVLITSGCALLDRGGEPGTGEVPGPLAAVAERAIADDFLGALVQIEGYAPDGTTVRFARDSIAEDAFVAELESLMREAGYAVRVLPGAAPGTVAHDVRIVGEGDAYEAVHTVSVGRVQMRRRYVETATGRWEPSGSLFVRGADASGIRLEEQGDTAPAPMAPVPGGRQTTLVAQGEAMTADAPDAAPTPETLASAEPASVPVPDAATAADDIARTSPVVRPRAPARPAPLAFDELSGKPIYSGLVADRQGVTARTRNIMDLGGSNYAGMLEDYGNVDELILMFPNDSLTLGEANKQLIRDALESFDPNSDTFSIVGCSLGPTRLENGNQALALGRANRVKEELLFAGVPNERIFDEGCWAGESTTTFPSRGVVLTHRRQHS